MGKGMKTQPYQIEHYELHGRPVAIVLRRDDRMPLQAWVANAQDATLERDDSLILDIGCSDDATFMPSKAFADFCHANGIEGEIPDNAIQRSLSLMAKTVFSANASTALPCPQTAVPSRKRPRGTVSALHVA